MNGRRYPPATDRLTYIPPVEKSDKENGDSEVEQNTALNWFEKLLVTDDIENNAKSVLGRVTDNTFNEKDVNTIYEQVLDNLSISEAKKFKDINPNSEKVILVRNNTRLSKGTSTSFRLIFATEQQKRLARRLKMGGLFAKNANQYLSDKGCWK